MSKNNNKEKLIAEKIDNSINIIKILNIIKCFILIFLNLFRQYARYPSPENCTKVLQRYVVQITKNDEYEFSFLKKNFTIFLKIIASVSKYKKHKNKIPKIKFKLRLYIKSNLADYFDKN